MKVLSVFLILAIPCKVFAIEPCPLWDDAFARQQINALALDIARHDTAYFEHHTTLISDHAYDALLQQYQSWQRCFIKASSISEQKNNIQKLGTLYKSKDSVDVEQFWHAHQNQTLILQPKIDGIAVSLTYNDGKLTEAATRRGQNILAHILAAPEIPKYINTNQTIVLHGELFINLHTISDKMLQRYVSARHLAAGLIQQHKPDHTILKSVMFFPWRWVNSTYETEQATIIALSELGFQLPLDYSHTLSSISQIASLRDHYSRSDNALFLMDGIVIKANQTWLQNHQPMQQQAIAWKFDPVEAQSTILDISYSVSKQNRVTPTAHIKPVTLNRKTITKLSLGSIKRTRERDIAIGDLINLQLKGDAIPVFDAVLFRPIDRRIPAFLNENTFDDLHTKTPSADIKKTRSSGFFERHLAC